MTDLIDGTYEVLEKLKEGGMGSVYLVRHVLLDEVRVMKTMRPRYQASAEGRQRFVREARLSTSLDHPNLPRFFDVGERADGSSFMVMELIDGPNLGELLRLVGRPPLATTLDIALQVLDALAYLHRRGIVHRDLSPENVMLTAPGGGELVVKLIDLGIAKDIHAEDPLTRTGAFLGKLRYTSPEQVGLIRRGESIDGRADLYSFACVLYLLLTGEPPFLADSSQGYALAHAQKPPRPFSETDPQGWVPESLRAAVRRCLEKDREDRFPGADELAAALRAIRESLPSDPSPLARLDAVRTWSSRRPRPVTGRSPKVTSTRPGSAGPSTWSGRRTTWAILGGSALVLVATGAGIVIVSGSRRPVAPPAVVAPPRPGTLLLTASPWGEVVSVADASGRDVPHVALTTPARLTLPGGSYLLTIRGPSASGPAELRVAATVRAGEETPLHVDLPGFDFESSIASHVR